MRLRRRSAVNRGERGGAKASQSDSERASDSPPRLQGSRACILTVAARPAPVGFTGQDFGQLG
eukprot:12898652-Alexandrium_andersonii.AAC.1